MPIYTKTWNKIKQYRWILLILLFSLVIRLFYSISHAVWWDSAVYIAMGKYIFSLGESGFWEASRPLVWPIILGFFWKINLNPIIMGRIFEMLFSLGSIYLTYLLGKHVFDEKTALFGSLMLSLSPVFFFFNTILLTAIPSLFFSLLGVYLFLTKKHFSAGIFLGLAFMTRFLQLGIFVVIGFYSLYLFKRKKITIKQISNLIYGFTIIILPYLIFNQIKYNNLLLPFLFQIFMTQNTGWIYNQPLMFYFTNLLKENALIIFALAGILFSRIRPKHNKSLIIWFVLTFLIYFTLIAHKETRFIITFLPYLLLLTAFGFIESYKSLKNIRFSKILFSFLIVFWLIQSSGQLFVYQPEPEFNKFQQYLSKNDVKDKIWITNPTFLVHTDKKAGIIYFPFFNTENAKLLTNNLDQANHILIDTCDLLCSPDDSECPGEKTNLIENIKDQFIQEYYEKKNDCELYIFTR